MMDKPLFLMYILIRPISREPDEGISSAKIFNIFIKSVIITLKE